MNKLYIIIYYIQAVIRDSFVNLNYSESCTIEKIFLRFNKS